MPGGLAVWQNQRYYPGAGWVGSEPSVLGTGFCKGDPPAWTTEAGEGTEPPVTTPEGGWLIAVEGGGVDAEGWAYGTSFEALGEERYGGRGCARLTDVARRRCWVWQDAADGGGSEPSPSRASFASEEELSGKRSSRQEEGGAAFSEAVSIVVGLLSKRPALHAVGMLSPIAWACLRRDHVRRYTAWVTSDLVPATTADDRARLRGLVFALPYAKAVYGYPMLRHYMDSVTTMVTMGALERMGIGSVDVRTNVGAMLQICGRSANELLHVSFEPLPLQPAHAVLLDHGASAVVLTIRGTNSPEDALTDAMATEVCDDEVCPDDESGSLHDGMLRAAKWVAEQAQPALEKASRQYPAYRLIITGHSLGAGVAAVLALLLDARMERAGSPSHGAGGCLPEANGSDVMQQVSCEIATTVQFPSIECYNFACPGIVSESVSLSPRAQRCVTTLVYARDVIVRLCFRSVDTLLQDLYAKSPTAGMLSRFGLAASSIHSSLRSSTPEAARETAKKASHWEQHLPVGRCLWLPDARQAEVGLLAADPRHFDHIIVHERMFTDHHLGAYAAALGRVCRQLGIPGGDAEGSPNRL